MPPLYNMEIAPIETCTWELESLKIKPIYDGFVWVADQPPNISIWVDDSGRLEDIA